MTRFLAVEPQMLWGGNRREKDSVEFPGIDVACIADDGVSLLYGGVAIAGIVEVALSFVSVAVCEIEDGRSRARETSCGEHGRRNIPEACGRGRGRQPACLSDWFDE